MNSFAHHLDAQRQLARRATLAKRLKKFAGDGLLPPATWSERIVAARLATVEGGLSNRS